MKPCKHHVKLVCWRCLFFTLGFPVEHMMWERIPLLADVTRWLGIA